MPHRLPSQPAAISVIGPNGPLEEMGAKPDCVACPNEYGLSDSAASAIVASFATRLRLVSARLHDPLGCLGTPWTPGLRRIRATAPYQRSPDCGSVSRSIRAPGTCGACVRH